MTSRFILGLPGDLGSNRGQAVCLITLSGQDLALPSTDPSGLTYGPTRWSNKLLIMTESVATPTLMDDHQIRLEAEGRDSNRSPIDRGFSLEFKMTSKQRVRQNHLCAFSQAADSNEGRSRTSTQLWVKLWGQVRSQGLLVKAAPKCPVQEHRLKCLRTTNGLQCPSRCRKS